MNEPAEIYRFGCFELDPESHELRREGAIVPLEPLVLDLLVYLIRHRNRVVTRDELVDTVWPDTLISDSALGQAILKARRAVDDDGRRQEVIRTVHGRGLRFVAEVTVPCGGESIEPGEAGRVEAVQATAAKPRKTVWLVAISAVALAGAAVLFFALTDSASEGESPVRVAILPFANLTEDPTLQWVELGLPRLMGRVLSERAGIEIVPTGSITDALERLAPDRPLLLEASAFDTLKRTYGLDHAVHAVFRREDNLYRLELVVFSDGKRRHRTEIADTQMPALLDSVAAALHRRLFGRSDETPVAVGLSDDPFVNRLYSMGLQEYATDNYQGAESYFRVCLDREPDLNWARYEIALCRRRLGEWDEAVAASREVLETALVDDDRRLQVAALVNMGVAHWRKGELDEAEHHYLSALAIAEEAGIRDQSAGIQLNLGILAKDRGLYDRSETHERRALATYREMGHTPNEANALNALGVLAWRRGDLETSRDMHSRALAIRREFGMRERAAASLNNLGTIERALGRWDEAERLFDEALAIRTELGDRLGRSTSLFNLSTVALYRGDPETASGLAEASLAIAEELGNQRRVEWNLEQLSEIARVTGNRKAARELRLRALEISRQLGDRQGEATHLIALAHLDLEDGDLSDAEGLADEVLEIANAMGDRNTEGDEARLRAAINLAHGDTIAAEGHLLRALDLARQSGNATDAMLAAVDLGTLLISLDRASEVDPLLPEIEIFAQSYPDAMLLIARREAALGDPERATEVARVARKLAGSIWTEEQQRILQEIEAQLP